MFAPSCDDTPFFMRRGGGEAYVYVQTLFPGPCCWSVPRAGGNPIVFFFFFNSR